MSDLSFSFSSFLRKIKRESIAEIKSSRRTQILFNYFSGNNILHMSEVEQPQQGDKNSPQKPVNRWTNISSDEDQSGSEHSQKQSKPVPEAKIEKIKQPVSQPPKEEPKKREQVITPFDPKKKFRGDFANIKTVKGGFKAEKLQQRKFQLNTIRNPFDVEDSQSGEENEEKKPTTETQPAPEAEKPVEQVQQSQEKGKKSKKSKKQQQKQQLEELLKELNGGKDQPEAGQEGEAKKKKKKKAKKAEGEVQGEAQQEVKEQTKVETQKKQETEAFEVNREQIEQVMKKKAAEATKSKKGGNKVSVAANARKAIEQRQAKNKSKKTYVDL